MLKSKFSLLAIIASYVPISSFEFNLVTDSHCMMDCLEVTNDILSNICTGLESWKLLIEHFCCLDLFSLI